jgi:hypothetical protein
VEHLRTLERDQRSLDGTEKMDGTAILATASSITERTKEIKGLLR